MTRWRRIAVAVASVCSVLVIVAVSNRPDHGSYSVRSVNPTATGAGSPFALTWHEQYVYGENLARRVWHAVHRSDGDWEAYLLGDDAAPSTSITRHVFKSGRHRTETADKRAVCGAFGTENCLPSAQQAMSLTEWRLVEDREVSGSFAPNNWLAPSLQTEHAWRARGIATHVRQNARYGEERGEITCSPQHPRRICPAGARRVTQIDTYIQPMGWPVPSSIESVIDGRLVGSVRVVHFAPVS